MNILNLYHLKGVVPDNAVYIGRANAKFNLPNSGWGNPFFLSDPSLRNEVYAQYKQWLDEQVANNTITIERLLTLEGKDLVCFCAPKLCHGHALKEKVEWAVEQRNAQAVEPRATPPEQPTAPVATGRWKRSSLKI